MPGEQIYFRQPKNKFKGDFLTWDQYRNPILSGSAASDVAATPVTAGSYTNTPAPQTGTGAFGLVPGAIGVPEPYNDLSRAYPQLGATNAAASTALLSQLRGELSPSAVAAIDDASARYGVESGMPGGQLSRHRTVRDIGATSEQLQQQGLQNYSPFISTVSNTQTVRPELQAEIAGTNATNAAAPNPSSAAYYSRWLFQRYNDLLKQGQNKSGLGGAIGTGLGAIGGAYFGGPAGAAVGAGAGGKIGSLFG